MTLAQAIEKVGIGGKVQNILHDEVFIVTGLGNKFAFLSRGDIESSYSLDKDGWTPVLPKKRVVLQAWEYKPTGGIFWYEHAPKNALIEDYAHRTDIPNMIAEDGKWVIDNG